MDKPTIRSPSGRHILSPRILVVDDDLVVLRSLSRVLKAWQPLAEIHCAQNGEEALKLLEKVSFHLLISDIQMPTMNGISLLAYVANRYPRIIRIAHSSFLDKPGSQVVNFLAHRLLKKGASSIEVLSATRWALDQLAQERPSQPPPSPRISRSYTS